MKLDKILLTSGLVVVAYAVFSSFYGAIDVAMMQFKSSTILLAANTLIILSLALKNK